MRARLYCFVVLIPGQDCDRKYVRKYLHCGKIIISLFTQIKYHNRIQFSTKTGKLKVSRSDSKKIIKINLQAKKTTDGR